MAIQPGTQLGSGNGRESTSELTDEALIADAVACRDQSAFGELVRRHQGRVRGYLRKLTCDPALADDLAQETFIKAWDKLATYAGRGRFVAWLLRVAHNQFLQALRKSDQDHRLRQRLEHESRVDDALPGAGARADAALGDLPRLLAVLSDEERAVMVLNYAYGFSHGEITRVTGLALGTVKSHIRRGRAKIRERFAIVEADRG